MHYGTARTAYLCRPPWLGTSRVGSSGTRCWSSSPCRYGNRSTHRSGGSPVCEGMTVRNIVLHYIVAINVSVLINASNVCNNTRL